MFFGMFMLESDSEKDCPLTLFQKSSLSIYKRDKIELFVTFSKIQLGEFSSLYNMIPRTDKRITKDINQ